MGIGERLRKLRKIKRMTQTELAELVGTSYVMISQYELGKRNPKQETLDKIASALNCTVDYLRGITDGATHAQSINKQINFWEYLRTLGYVVGGDLAEGYIWITHDGYDYEVTLCDLDVVENCSESYVRYTLNEILAKSRKLPHCASQKKNDNPDEP